MEDFSSCQSLSDLHRSSALIITSLCFPVVTPIHAFAMLSWLIHPKSFSVTLFLSALVQASTAFVPGISPLASSALIILSVPFSFRPSDAYRSFLLDYQLFN